MLPHAGTDTKIWREVRALGAELRSLQEVQGSTVAAEVALLWDCESWWAGELDSHPVDDLSYLEAMRAYYEPLWRAGVTTDFVHPQGRSQPVSADHRSQPLSRQRYRRGGSGELRRGRPWAGGLLLQWHRGFPGPRPPRRLPRRFPRRAGHRRRGVLPAPHRRVGEPAPRRDRLAVD